MRYLHNNVLDIIDYVHSKDLTIESYSYDGSLMITDPGPNLIGDMLKKSETLWGSNLPYYLRVLTPGKSAALSLKEAVARIEGRPLSDDFLLVAYQDGGLISISGEVLPFQRGARAAQWWRP